MCPSGKAKPAGTSLRLCVAPNAMWAGIARAGGPGPPVAELVPRAPADRLNMRCTRSAGNRLRWEWHTWVMLTTGDASRRTSRVCRCALLTRRRNVERGP